MKTFVDRALAISLLALLSTSIERLSAQNAYSTLGEPIIDIFSASDYQANTQNWFVSQDDDGVIYVGNGSGILSYDASRWLLHQTEDAGPIHGMAQKDGKTYVGTISEIGYFQQDTLNQLGYHSLTNSLPSKMRNFSDVLDTFIYDDKVFWLTYQSLIAKNSDGSYSNWLPESTFRRAMVADDQLYLSDQPHLKKLENGALKIVSGFEFLDNPRFTFVLPLKDKLLVGTKSQGIFTWKDGLVKRWSSQTAHYSKLWIFKAKQINNQIVAATIDGGVLFFDLSGQFLYQLDQSKGLPSNVVIDFTLDKQNGLWLAQAGFITRVRLPYDISIFSQEKHNTANINNIFVKDGEIYTAGVLGLHRLNSPLGFSLYSHEKFPIRDMLIIDDRMVGVGAGVHEYDLKSGKKYELLNDVDSGSLYVPNNYPKSLLMSASDGIYLSQINNEAQWSPARKLFPTENKPSEWAEDEFGHLWLAISKNKIIEISPENGWQVKSYPIDLPHRPSFFNINEMILLSTSSGLFNFDIKQKKITTKVSWFKNHFRENSSGPDVLIQDSLNMIWLRIGDVQGVLSQPNSQGDVLLVSTL